MLCLYICHRLFVNLSAFVLVGSPMVLSSTKAESILRDFNRRNAKVLRCFSLRLSVSAVIFNF